MLELLILSALGILIGGYVLYRRRAGSNASPAGAKAVFVCRHCGEQHCECEKTE